MFIEALSSQSKKLSLAVCLSFFPLALMAGDIEGDIKTMQKAIVMLMDFSEKNEATIQEMKQRNTELEKQVQSLKEKIEKGSSKKGQGTVEILSVAPITSETEMVQGTGKVLAKTINVREYASLTSKILSFLEEGNEVEFTELVTDTEGIKWAHLKKGGYASIKWLDLTIKDKKGTR